MKAWRSRFHSYHRMKMCSKKQTASEMLGPIFQLLVPLKTLIELNFIANFLLSFGTHRVNIVRVHVCVLCQFVDQTVGAFDLTEMGPC